MLHEALTHQGCIYMKEGYDFSLQKVNEDKRTKRKGKVCGLVEVNCSTT